MNNVVLTLILFLLVAACGGGGGGGSASTASSSTFSSTCTSSSANNDGIIVPCSNTSFNLTTNSTTTSYDANDYSSTSYGGWVATYPANNDPGRGTRDVTNGWASSSTAYESNTGVAASVIDVTGYYELPTDHLTDTSASSAWAAGYSGQGVTMNIIDDHNDADTNVDLGSYSINRNAYYGDGTTEHRYESTHTVYYQDSSTFSHGFVVANIAGGDKRDVTEYNVTTTYLSQTTNTCTKTKDVVYNVGLSSNSVTTVNESVANTNCFNNFSSPSWSSAVLTVVPGIAKDATMIRTNIDLNASAQVALSNLQSHHDASIDHDIVNYSLSVDLPAGETWTSLKSYEDNSSISATFSWTEGTKTVNAMYVIASGNEGAACSSGDLVNCNYLAALALLDSDIGDQSIIVGATDTVSGTKTIWSSSNRAGVMKDRFIVADGGCGYKYYSGSGAGTEIKGTSCAAPKVSGAAAIVKSKFPNLSAADLSDILLLTADKDIDDNGVDDFSSTSTVYGRGELDLPSALSPVGNLTP